MNELTATIPRVRPMPDVGAIARPVAIALLMSLSLVVPLRGPGAASFSADETNTLRTIEGYERGDARPS